MHAVTLSIFYTVVVKGVWRGIAVAIKQFHDALRQEYLLVTDDYKKLFHQELTTCAQLHHPNILTFLGATLEQGMPIQLIMELLEGSLKDLIEVALASGSYLTHREQVDLAVGTTAGITFLHQLKPLPFVHCNIQPSNILVSRDMTAKVGDLGVHSIVGGTELLNGNYIAPERVQGSPASPLTDVYSLGATLTALFTGDAAGANKRDEQLPRIADTDLQHLCTEATLTVTDARPTAAHMLVQLQHQKEAEKYLVCPVRRLVVGKVEGDEIKVSVVLLRIAIAAAWPTCFTFSVDVCTSPAALLRLPFLALSASIVPRPT
jgi:serine/threonine protein kinase